MNEHLQQFIGVCFDGLTNLNKFHDVDTPFAAFVFGDERLRPRQAFDDGVAALEASLSPAGKVVAFLAMTGDGHPITDRDVRLGRCGRRVRQRMPALFRLLGCRLLTRSDVPLPRERFRIYSGENVFDAINKGLLWPQKYRARRRQSFRMHRLACRDDLVLTSANIQAVRRFQER